MSKIRARQRSESAHSGQAHQPRQVLGVAAKRIAVEMALSAVAVVGFLLDSRALSRFVATRRGQ